MDNIVALNFAKENGYQKVKFLTEWNGKMVFKIVRSLGAGLHLGAPPLIIVDGKSARYADFFDELDIIDALPE